MGSSTPNWSQWLASIWGPETDGTIPLAIISAASNVVCGSNPPYTIQDFFGFYPAFGGTPALVPNVTTAAEDNEVTAGQALPSGLAIGNPLSGAGIPDGM